MRFFLLAIGMLLATFAFSQNAKGKTFVIKVRAPLAKCKIEFSEPYFLLEKESDIKVQVSGKNPKIRVEVKGGKILSEKGETYRLRFLSAGTVAISVFQLTDNGAKLIGTKKGDVRAPQIYFCSLATDSFTKVLRLGPCHVYAHSEFFKANLPMKKFSMLYYDEVLVNGRWQEKIDTLHSDTCRLTPEMKKRLNVFQPKTNKMYLYNLVCSLPDGSIRVLEPVELLGLRDSAAMTARPVCIFNLKKKKI
jgi:hypothetical protein